LANNNTEAAETIKFKGREYVIAPRSISILPDCKTVVYNTAQVKKTLNTGLFEQKKQSFNKFLFVIGPDCFSTHFKELYEV